jgi:chemotaxis protein histidine kinase CheA/ActR/RegA family two-component response regulator
VNFDAAERAQLLSTFIPEAEEAIAGMRPLVAGFRSGPIEGAIRDFGRIAHGLKGAASTLQYAGLARALHGLEALVLGLARSDPATLAKRCSRIDSALDLLSEGITRMAASRQDAFPEDLLAPLLGLVDAPDVLGAGPSCTPRPDEKSGHPQGRSTSADTGAAPRDRADAAGERISVPAGEVDEALRIAASLARGVAQLQEALRRVDGDLAGSAQSLAVAAGGLEAIIASLRLVPADAALSALEEEVADIAARLGKGVVLSVSGRDVRADRRTLQTARGMIRHLVRNAIDHGIESGAARAAAGKPDVGHLSVAVEAGESTLRVRVSDDGAGFDVPAIRGELARRNSGADGVATMTDREVLRAWAFEGGSTRTTATEISGRGLGLSAVARMAHAAGGGVDVVSARGKGSDVEFTLPLEVYAVEALVVGAGGRLFGIPLAAIVRTIHLAPAVADGLVQDGAAGRTIALGDTLLPLGTLVEALGIARTTGRERFAVVVHSEGAAAALAVDEVGAVDGMVPSNVAGVAQPDAPVTGIARLGDGSAVSILNPRRLVSLERSRRQLPLRERAQAGGEASPPPAALDVVLAEDSLATREVIRVLLEAQGFRVRLAADGDEALARIAERKPHVLVSDVNMPGTDGLSLTRTLRGRADTERLPIVLLTSQDDDATRAAGAAAGADAYLIKSRFDADVLHATLARIGVKAT